MCVHIYFSDSGNNSNIFIFYLYIRMVGDGRVLVCYQLVNKPYDWINVLQDIWEDNVTIINIFTTLSHEKCYCRTHHNHYRMPFVHRFILHSTKHLLFIIFLLFFVVYIKLLILPPQAFFGFLVPVVLLCIVYMKESMLRNYGVWSSGAYLRNAIYIYL